MERVKLSGIRYPVKKSKNACHVFGCKHKPTSVHKLPNAKKYLKKNELWLKVLQIENPDRRFNVCNNHFKDDDFCRVKGKNKKRRRLKCYAVPSVKLSFSNKNMSEKTSNSLEECEDVEFLELSDDIDTNDLDQERPAQTDGLKVDWVQSKQNFTGIIPDFWMNCSVFRVDVPNIYREHNYSFGFGKHYSPKGNSNDDYTEYGCRRPELRFFIKACYLLKKNTSDIT